MHCKFYFSATGSERSVHALNDALEIADCEIKQLKPNPLDQTPQQERWLWRSPYQTCNSNFPEDELTTYLRENPKFLLLIKKHRADLKDFGPVIVSQPDHEGIRGCSISSELINLLASINASLEIDIINFN